MNDHPSGFEYKSEEFQPLRALSIAIALAQVIGAAVSLWVAYFPSWFENLWFGGALATLPGYLIGLAVQRRRSPNSLILSRALARRMGLVSAVLSLSALVVPLGVLG